MPRSQTTPRWSVLDPRTRWGRLYLGVLLLRCLSAFLGYGYIHPDEWMQSGEPYFWIGNPNPDAQLPWEWHPDKALRSLFALSQLYMPAEGLLFLWGKLAPVSGFAMFLVQRAGMLLWTLCLDAAIVFTFPPKTARYLLCLHGISTATTTFMVRPFSNSHEALLFNFCLLWTLASYLRPTEHTKAKMAASPIVPAVLAVHGFFTRFTFAVFVLPLALFINYCTMHFRSGSRALSLVGALAAGLFAIVSFYLCAVTDTKFYARLAQATGTKVATVGGTRWVIAPINALVYNAKTDNVAQHGLHPRWLHAAVNLPMMVGVANCVVLVIRGWQFARRSWTPFGSARPLHSSTSSSTDRATSAAQTSDRKAANQIVDLAATATGDRIVTERVDLECVAVGLCLSTLVFSLAILSISPHQEPRFLVALALPSSVVMAYALQSHYLTLRPRLVRILVTFHVVQHVVQLVFFSFLHQGALVAVLFSIDRSLSLSQGRVEHHILYRTFPVPLHLVPHASSHIIEQHDSSSHPAEVVHSARSRCPAPTWIYTPSWAVDQLMQAATHHTNGIALVPTHSFGWHLDTDHLAETWALATHSSSFKDAFAIQKLAVHCTTRAANRVVHQPNPPAHFEL